jgi:hypothetical protein
LLFCAIGLSQYDERDCFLAAAAFYLSAELPSSSKVWLDSLFLSSDPAIFFVRNSISSGLCGENTCFLYRLNAIIFPKAGENHTFALNIAVWKMPLAG